MQSPAGRRGSTRINGVVAVSPCETRMKLDQVKGGIKVANASDDIRDPASADTDDAGRRVYNLRLRRNQSAGAAERRKRKNWCPPDAAAMAVEAAADRSPSARLRKTRSSPSPNCPRVMVKASPKAGEERNVAGTPRTLSITDDCGSIEVGKDLEGEENSEGGCEEQMEIEAGSESFDDKEVDMAGEEMKMTPGNAEKVAKYDQINQTCDVPLNEEAKKLEEEPRAVNPYIVSPSPKTVDISDLPEPSMKAIDLGTVLQDAKTPTAATQELYPDTPESQHRMKSIVNLVMWRDISRSAFVFGTGSFLLLSSSYTRDLNFSFISATSYLGLVYLAAIFLYKSVIRRGAVDWEETSSVCVVGEEEAIWLARLLLPYINEMLIKLQSLFTGDPETTMKLAVILFLLARCGGAITFWTMIKLAFFGAFMVPKICSSYSVQLARYGNFWLERARDAWESCQHKKAVAATVFTLIWNLSSTVARVWAVFMLAVAVRFYQQRLLATDEVAEEEDALDGSEGEEAAEVRLRRRRQGGAEDAKHQPVGGASPEQAADGRVASPPLGPSRQRQAGGPGPVTVPARRKKKWS